MRFRPFVPQGQLYSDAEFDIMSLVARVGIEVIRGATRELVALPKFASDHQANRKNADAC